MRSRTSHDINKVITYQINTLKSNLKLRECLVEQYNGILK